MLTENDLQPVRIRLDDDDIRTGFEFEVEMARLTAKLEMIQQMRAGHAAQMREKYGAGAEYRIEDWLTGFELIGDAKNGE
jgi:hypothetical protein